MWITKTGGFSSQGASYAKHDLAMGKEGPMIRSFDVFLFFVNTNVNHTVDLLEIW